MSFESDLQQYQNSRRMPNWKPKAPKAAHTPAYSKYEKADEEIVRRCLAFINLEIQVQQWVDTVRNYHPTLPESEATALQNTLAINSLDEQKHDRALRMLAEYYNGAHSSPEADALVLRWQQLNAHPIVAAYVLECGVFFTILPLLMNCGDIYAATVGQWINDDERVHVETNLRIMKHLGLKLDANALRLVHDTVNFIYQPYGVVRASVEAARSVKRVTSGKDKQMLRESLPVTTAFFEQKNKQSIVY